MLDSIWEDLKMQYRNGNMLTRIIMLNIAVFVFLRIIIALTGFSNPMGAGPNHEIMRWLSLPSGLIDLLKKPWTLITHMFLHYGFWHILWNMLWLYWFARIIGDFLGDRRVLPLYILGGLAGALAYIIVDQLFVTGGHATAMGASAAVMAFVTAAANLSPDYEMRFILIGSIKIKYIALFFIVMDLISISGSNSGGHVGHLGGAALGVAFVYLLRQGTDITLPIQNLIYGKKPKEEPRLKKRTSPIKVVHRNEEKVQKRATKINFEQRLDLILDKINQKGIDSLTEEERAFLDAASKKN